MNPLADQQQPQPPQGAAQGQPNPLAQLAGALRGLPPRMPAPTAAQTRAGLRRFDAVMGAMRQIMKNPELGRTNQRPAIMDQASRLLSARVLSLAELMNAIAPLNDQPLAQKQLVAGIYNSAFQASNALLDHHGAAVAAGRVSPDSGDYSADSHDEHMTALLAHYPSPARS